MQVKKLDALSYGVAISFPRFANRDRRPLDPPNVAEAVFYEQFDVDGEIQHQLIPAKYV